MVQLLSAISFEQLNYQRPVPAGSLTSVSFWLPSFFAALLMDGGADAANFLPADVPVASSDADNTRKHVQNTRNLQDQFPSH